MSDTSLSQSLQRAPLDMLREIIRQAEAHLATQLTAAIAADQRAYTFSGLISAAVVLLVGASHSFATHEAPNAVLAVVSGAVAVCLFISAWLAAMSARSVGFEFMGSRPGVWDEDIDKSLQESLAEQCQHYDGMITKNRILMESNSKMFNCAVNISLTSLGFGGLIYLVIVGNALTSVSS